VAGRLPPGVHRSPVCFVYQPLEPVQLVGCGQVNTVDFSLLHLNLLENRLCFAPLMFQLVVAYRGKLSLYYVFIREDYHLIASRALQISLDLVVNTPISFQGSFQLLKALGVLAVVRVQVGEVSVRYLDIEKGNSELHSLAVVALYMML
jgi:hypothetical protein